MLAAPPGHRKKPAAFRPGGWPRRAATNLVFVVDF
jgi:hypothetical protein